MLDTFETIQSTILYGGGAFIGLQFLLKGLKGKRDKLASSNLGRIKELKNILGNNGISISKHIQLNNVASMNHAFCIGPTGCHKTSTFFLPNLLNEKIKGSFIATDLAGELYKNTSAFQRYMKRETPLFAPLEPKISCRYNALAECWDETEVKMLAQNILLNSSMTLELSRGVKAGGTEWLNMATSLLASILIYCRNSGYPLNNLTHATRLFLDTSDNDLELILKHLDIDAYEQYKMFKKTKEADKMAASIKGTLSTSLGIFLDKNIMQTTSTTDFKAEDMRITPTALYIMYPEIKANYLSPIMSIVFTQMINHLMESYTENSLDMYCLLDELTNLGLIPMLPNIISTSRKKRINFTMGIQNITQLNQVYGRDNAQTILSNTMSKVIYDGLTDLESLRFISEICGDTEIEVEENSKTFKRKKPLFNKDEVRRLNDNEELIIIKNKLPLKDEQNFYLDNRYFKNVVQSNFRERY